MLLLKAYTQALEELAPQTTSCPFPDLTMLFGGRGVAGVKNWEKSPTAGSNFQRLLSEAIIVVRLESKAFQVKLLLLARAE